MIKIKHNSTAFYVLKRLVDLGGVAIRAQLSPGFKAVVFYNGLEALRCRFLIEENGTAIRATAAGKAQVAEFEPLEPAVVSAPLQMVLPRVPKPFKPLSMSCGPVPYRPGADEYRSIPSLMGATRRLPSGEVVE